MDDTHRRYVKIFYGANRTMGRNIEIMRDILDGMSYADTARKHELSPVRIQHIVETMVRYVKIHSNWLGLGHPWTRERCPAAYYHYKVNNEYLFVPRLLTREQIREEKDFILEILQNLYQLMLEYISWREQNLVHR